MNIIVCIQCAAHRTDEIHSYNEAKRFAQTGCWIQLHLYQQWELPFCSAGCWRLLQCCGENPDRTGNMFRVRVYDVVTFICISGCMEVWTPWHHIATKETCCFSAKSANQSENNEDCEDAEGNGSNSICVHCKMSSVYSVQLNVGRVSHCREMPFSLKLQKLFCHFVHYYIRRKKWGAPSQHWIQSWQQNYVAVLK